MERLTAYDGDYYYPHCMRGSTCDGRGPSEKCKECEFDDRICVTLGKYEDTGLTPEQVMELKERNTAKAVQKAEEQPYFRKHFHSYTCPVCHKKVEPRWSFCGYCGQKIKEED